MSTSPPDLSQLSLQSHQRIHDSYDYDGSNHNRHQYHFATTSAIPTQSQYNPLVPMTQSPLKNKPVRSGLPAQWLENSADSRSLSPHNNSDFSSTGGSPPLGHANPTIPTVSSISPANPDDEIIPTAIVIKNIPFNVKRETLLGIIESLNIPTPYAFNYHLDQQGSFRGLAFANFRQAADADAVVAALNGFDVQGRKLRVEYKKVLQAGEKERIEREKAIRRMRSMQLEKEQSAVAAAQQAPPAPVYDEYPPHPLQHSFVGQRTASNTYQQQQSQQQQQQQHSPPGVTTLSSPYALSLNAGAITPSQSSGVSDKGSANELDMNEPATLEIFSRILLFKGDNMRDELAFSRNLTPKQRRIVHLIAQKLGVYHYSVGEGDERYVVVTKIDPQQQQPTHRQPAHSLSRAPSAYLTPSAQMTQASTLRAKKSMPDMKTLHQQAPRLNPRSSNGNIREGYATIASPSRRISTPGFSSLFPIGSPFGGNSVPPVPSLPTTITSSTLNGGHDTVGGVVRQPRGPGIGGFGRRESKVGPTEGPITRGGLEAQTYEPLDL